MNIKKTNQSLIEKKIREFQEGVDYAFAGETHKASEKAPPIIVGDKEEKNSGYFVGYTLRSFDILSLRLKKTLRETLAKQAEILLSLDFQWAEGDGGTIISKFQANSNDNCSFLLVDQDDNFFSYRSEIGERKEGQLLIYYTELDPENKKKRAENYQVAQQAWAEKVQKNGGRELTIAFPPSGTKCRDCGEVISDEDINQGNYYVDNQRWNSWMDRTFTHGRLTAGKKCQGRKLEAGEKKSFRYHYHFEVAEKWEQKKEHEQSHPNCCFLCRDRLQKFHRQFSENLVYLEKYLGQESATEKRSKEIASTKKNLAEIEKRLSIMKSDQPQKYASCDIKCSECEQKLCLHKNCQVGQGCPQKNCRRGHKNGPAQKDNDSKSNNTKNQEGNSSQPTDLTLIIGLGIGGVLVFFGLVIFWLKRSSKSKH